MSGSFASLAKLRTHTCRITLSFALNGLGVACNIEKRRATATGDPARPSRRAASASPACCRPESSPSPPYLLCDGDLASQSSGATGAEESRGVASEQGEEACSLFDLYRGHTIYFCSVAISSVIRNRGPTTRTEMTACGFRRKADGIAASVSTRVRLSSGINSVEPVIGQSA